MDYGQIKLENCDVASFPLNILALAGIFIQRFTVFFQRRIHWRHLCQRTSEALGEFCQHCRRDVRHRPGFNDVALGVCRGRFLTETHRGFVGFVGF